MKFQKFVLGSLAVVVLTAVAGVAVGLSWPAVLGLGLAVWVVAQVLYVGLVALMARDEAKGRDRASSAADRPEPRSGGQIGENRTRG